MGVSLIFKIAAVGILVTILSQVLKHSGREEHAFLISLAGLILVLTWIVPYIFDCSARYRHCFRYKVIKIVFSNLRSCVTKHAGGEGWEKS